MIGVCMYSQLVLLGTEHVLGRTHLYTRDPIGLATACRSACRPLRHLHGDLYRQKFRRLLNQASGFFRDLVQIALRDSISFLRVGNCMSACGDESPEVRGAQFHVLRRGALR